MYHRVLINGNLEIMETRRMVSAIFQLLHPKYTPLPVLQKNVTEICKLLEGYCKRKKKSMVLDRSERRRETVRQRARMTFMIKKLQSIQRSFRYAKTRPEFIVKYYNLVLDLEGMGFLPGYGIMVKISRARLKVNPELISLRELQQQE